MGWHLGPKVRTKIPVRLWFWAGDQVGRKWFKATSFSILKVELGRKKTGAEEEPILSPTGVAWSEIDPTKAQPFNSSLVLPIRALGLPSSEPSEPTLSSWE